MVGWEVPGKLPPGVSVSEPMATKTRAAPAAASRARTSNPEAGLIKGVVTWRSARAYVCACARAHARVFVLCVVCTCACACVCMCVCFVKIFFFLIADNAAQWHLPLLTD